MKNGLADFLELPNADASPLPSVSVDEAKAELLSDYNAGSDAYDEIASAIYSPWAQEVGSLATGLRCIGDDCGAELLAAFKSGYDAIGPIQRKIANDFYGQLGVAYTELNGGIEEILQANPDAIQIVPELIESGNQPPGDLKEAPGERPPYVPPVWEPSPEPLPQPYPEPSPVPYPLPVPMPSPAPGPAGGRNGGSFPPVNLDDWCGPGEWIGIPPGGTLYADLSGFGSSGDVSGLRTEFFPAYVLVGGKRIDGKVRLDAMPGAPGSCRFEPTVPATGADACPTGPACLADLTAENVRRALFRVNTAQTSLDREKAVQGLVALMGVHLEAGKATSDWDCPSEPTECEIPDEGDKEEPPAGLPRPSLTSPPDWCSLDVCKTIKEPEKPKPGCDVFGTGCDVDATPGDEGDSGGFDPLPEEDDDTTPFPPASGLRTRNAANGNGSDPGADNGNGKPPAPVPAPCPSLLVDPAGFIGCQFNAALQSLGLPECSAAYVGQFAGALIERYVGVDMTPFLQPYRYWANWCSPTLIPSPTDLNALYLFDSIDGDQWECLTKANDLCPEWAKKVRDTGRLRINADDAYKMQAMGQLTEDEYAKELRKNGAIDADDLKRWKQSKEAVPSPSDVLRFVARDVDDDAIVARFKLDADFDKAYSGYTKKALTANGINEELAKRYYRAAWELPSPTQGFEMLHRLRPKRVKPELEFTSADLTELLKAADYPDYFRERLEEISYAVPTRTDAERLYDAGEWTKSEYEEALQDAGYKADFAKKLSTFFERDKKRQQRSRLACFTTGDALNWYRDGYVDAEFLRGRLEMETNDEEAIGTALEMADVERSIADMKESVSLAKGQYVSGCIDEAQAAMWMRSANVPDQTIERNLAIWKTVRGCSARQLTAGEICKMVERGLLGKSEALKRLVRIGFSAEDAELALSNCVTDISERMYKELVKQLEKMEKERKAKEKDDEKLRKKREKELACGPEKIKCPK